MSGTPGGLATRLAAGQRANNRETAPHRALYATHRRIVSDHILAPAGDSLCVLGAGNANDIDLARLAASIHDITLVDLDEEALQRALERVPASLRERITLRAPVDLSGLAGGLRGDAPSAGDVRAFRADLDGSWDVVASTCVLTQLIDGARHAAPLESVDDLALAVRDTHLDLLVRTVRPGGAGILVTDIVSSDTLPALHDAGNDDLPDLMLQALGASNFFTGTNPFRLREELHARGVDAIVKGPWRWPVTPHRHALVVALSFCR